MRCFVLDATNKSITAVLAGAAATTNPDFTAAYGDAITTTFTEGANDGAMNGTTPVTIVAAPAASTRRIVTAISIQNRDTAAVVLTVRYVDGANTRQIWSGTLAVGDTWTMDGVMNALGSMKTAFAGSHTALSDIGTNTHAQVDTHIADASDPHGATLTQTNITVGTEINTVAWTDYVASSTVIGWSSKTDEHIKYKKVGKLVFVEFYFTGTSNSVTTSFTLPYTHVGDTYVFGVLYGQDNASVLSTPGLIYVDPSSATVNLYKTFATAAWTASGTKEVGGSFWYEATA